MHERGGPPLGVKTGVVRAEDAVEHGAAHLLGEQPVVVRGAQGVWLKCAMPTSRAASPSLSRSIRGARHR